MCAQPIIVCMNKFENCKVIYVIGSLGGVLCILWSFFQQEVSATATNLVDLVNHVCKLLYLNGAVGICEFFIEILMFSGVSKKIDD